jgi:hypothetical protein
MLAMARTGEITWNGQPFTRRGPVARPRGPRTLADLIIEDRDER